MVNNTTRFNGVRMNRQLTRCGATTVEFAIASVALFMMVFGIVECTRISMLRHSADHAAYNAARKAMVVGANPAEIRQTALDHLAVLGVNSAVVTVSPASITDSTPEVEVTVSIPVASNSLVIPKFVSGSLIGSSKLVTERAPMQMSMSMPTPPPPPPPPTSPPPSSPPPPPGPPSPPPPPPPPPPTI